MSSILSLFVIIPLVIMAIMMCISKKSETLISTLSIVNGITLLALSIFASIDLIANNFHPSFQRHITLYQSPEFDFTITYIFDKLTMFFAILGSFIFIMVSRFSKFYMHREEGFKRYFVVMNLFFFGYMITVAGGNFETLFIGWEVLGVCSFLLISFYRDRYLPVKNALKVVSLFRLGDVCLILALWACHHLFHKNISFEELSTVVVPHVDSYLLFFILCMILIASLIKSAAFPFSSWLPRSMEGPTASSAIFYGSLSVHLGIFLLMRSYPLWSDVLEFKILVIGLGILTTFVAINIASVQSTVKTQIAYSSIAQIGIMMVEIALDLQWLLLIHFACNALYRTYQLLISPSVMNYQIHDMFFKFTKKDAPVLSKFQNSLYMLNIKEWNLDSFQFNYLWQPFKKIGQSLNFIRSRFSIAIFVLLFISGILYTGVEHKVHPTLDNIFTHVFAVLGLLLVLKSFASRRSGLVVWFYLILGQGFVTLSVFVNEHVPMHKILIYLSGIGLAAFLGLYALLQLRKIDGDLSLGTWHSYAQEKPTASLLLLIACLALLGFPFTPTFLGIDLLFTHINSHQYLMVSITALSFIFIEFAALRLYARLCMGLSKKNDRVRAWRSS
jgi:NADH-quinone oxidoreductase subunit L